MEDTRYVYWTNFQAATVTVRSGSNPPSGSQIDLATYSLMVSSNTPATQQSGGYVFPQNTMLTVEAAKSSKLGDPNWSFPFQVSTDSSVQVGQITDP